MATYSDFIEDCLDSAFTSILGRETMVLFMSSSEKLRRELSAERFSFFNLHSKRKGNLTVAYGGADGFSIEKFARTQNIPYAVIGKDISTEKQLKEKVLSKYGLNGSYADKFCDTMNHRTGNVFEMMGRELRRKNLASNGAIKSR